jgi:hypothetical protein
MEVSKNNAFIVEVEHLLLIIHERLGLLDLENEIEMKNSVDRGRIRKKNKMKRKLRKLFLYAENMMYHLKPPLSEPLDPLRLSRLSFSGEPTREPRRRSNPEYSIKRHQGIV